MSCASRRVGTFLEGGVAIEEPGGRCPRSCTGRMQPLPSEPLDGGTVVKGIEEAGDGCPLLVPCRDLKQFLVAPFRSEVNPATLKSHQFNEVVNLEEIPLKMTNESSPGWAPHWLLPGLLMCAPAQGGAKQVYHFANTTTTHQRGR